jgi:hypothetical protein
MSDACMDPIASRLTPINDDYPSCERTFATLRIYPASIAPLEISERLGITPSATNLKGREITNSLGKSRTQPINAWFLSSENAVSSKDVRPHLDWLLNALEPRIEQLLELQCLPGMRMNVHCSWWSAEGQGGPTIWPEQMTRLSRLNLECTFDVGFFGVEEGDDREAKLTIS